MWLVKIIVNDDLQIEDDPKWHLVQSNGDAPRTVCTGEVFGYGETRGKSEEKHTGKITCPECIKIVKWFKQIKL